MSTMELATVVTTQQPREPWFDHEPRRGSRPIPYQAPLGWPHRAGGTFRWSRPAESPPGVRRTGVSADAKQAVRRFVKMCVEVLNGYRPPAHLRRLSQPGEAPTVVAEGLAGARRVACSRRTPPRSRRSRPAPVCVVKLRLCEPRPGAVEAAAILVIGDRTWAMALRLELHGGSWMATTLRLI